MNAYESPFHGAMSLDDAREILKHRASEGEKCPVCTRNVKVYRRALTSVAARAVAALYEEHRLTFGHMADVARKHLPDSASQGGYLVLGQHWDLIESEPLVRGEVGRTGYWRVTDKGEAFLAMELSVPKYAHVFKGGCLALDGPLITFRDALGERFDFRALMAQRPDIGTTQLFPTTDSGVLDRKAA